MLEIIIRDVIGWNVESQCPTEKPGLFGIPEAFAASIEEQGRATLHCHIQVWIRQYNEWRDMLHSLSRVERSVGKRKIVELIDSVSSSSLFSVKCC